MNPIRTAARVTGRDAVFGLPIRCRCALHLFLLLIFAAGTYTLNAQSGPVNTEMTAEQAYREGFVHNVMKAGSNDGVRLDNYVLYENDGPGAGRSEKGPYTESIHEGVLARKLFHLEDPQGRRAHIIFYMMDTNPGSEGPDFGSGENQSSYYLIVNGTRIPGNKPSWHEPAWRWVEIPVQLLKRGLNEVVIGSDAPEGEGYQLLFAREDEYKAGGGKYTYQGNTAMISADQIRPSEGEGAGELKPIRVGATSAKSTDGGKTWTMGKLGPDSDIAGEYTVRLHLERFKPRGTLASPPIDLWADPDHPSVVLPETRVESLRLTASGFTPEGTQIDWQIRSSDTKNMLDDKAWGDWQTLGSGSEATLEPEGISQRYLQWRAVLKTTDPLQTPIVKRVQVRRRLQPDPVPENTYYVADSDNARHRYSSYRIAYENPQHPALEALQKRLNLDSVVTAAPAAGGVLARTGTSAGRLILPPNDEGRTGTRKIYPERTGDTFGKMNRLRHFVSTLWYHDSPFPSYPEWNAHEILDRNERVGAGGMCIQFSIVFMQALQRLGYNARHVNMFAHETIETWVDDLEKYVLIDPESVFDSYQFNTRTGEPLNALEQHRYFLKQNGFSARNPIDWTSPEPWAWPSGAVEISRQPLDFSTFTPHINDPNNPPPLHNLAGFLRWIPRTDFLSRPTPRPLTQGGIQWPWNGYVNWYDAATPRKLQYALHTDREADLYPTLNRVEYAATYGESEGQIEIQMITNTPNIETFEINIDGQGWQPAPAEFTWQLKPAARNTLRMRTRNTVGKSGKASRLVMYWHYRAPYEPRQASN